MMKRETFKGKANRERDINFSSTFSLFTARGSKTMLSLHSSTGFLKEQNCDRTIQAKELNRTTLPKDPCLSYCLYFSDLDGAKKR